MGRLFFPHCTLGVSFGDLSSLSSMRWCDGCWWEWFLVAAIFGCRQTKRLFFSPCSLLCVHWGLTSATVRPFPRRGTMRCDRLFLPATKNTETSTLFCGVIFLFVNTVPRIVLYFIPGMLLWYILFLFFSWCGVGLVSYERRIRPPSFQRGVVKRFCFVLFVFAAKWSEFFFSQLIFCFLHVFFCFVSVCVCLLCLSVHSIFTKYFVLLLRK